jgi:hypothetical protein
MKKLHRLKFKNLIFKALILTATVFFLFGCGKKGPPVPPGQTQIPAISELRFFENVNFSQRR